MLRREVRLAAAIGRLCLTDEPAPDALPTTVDVLPTTVDVLATEERAHARAGPAFGGSTMNPP
ncbi:hypothetical protein [Streptomyces sp. NPDC001717]|uniref:hypothetical protein n=1 Tax=Streptomyces sp. NPDC001717 TaxID=3364604 RepID=UPI0036975AE1